MFVDGPQSGPLDTAYGVATIASGIGLILAGIAVVRTGRWRGWARWTPLALGVLVFVMVIPGLFGTFLEARLAITAWMLAWTALGVALLAVALVIALALGGTAYFLSDRIALTA